MDVTVADRQKARRIIEDLRRDYTPTYIAELFGVRRLYIQYACGMIKHSKKNAEHTRCYACPKKVIRKILEYGAMLGYRNTPHRTAFNVRENEGD